MEDIDVEVYLIWTDQPKELKLVLCYLLDDLSISERSWTKEKERAREKIYFRKVHTNAT